MDLTGDDIYRTIFLGGGMALFGKLVFDAHRDRKEFVTKAECKSRCERPWVQSEGGQEMLEFRSRAEERLKRQEEDIRMIRLAVEENAKEMRDLIRNIDQHLASLAAAQDRTDRKGGVS